MELLQLRYFSAIAKHESVTAAANEFGIPQSAMSQTLSRLEKELGNIKLFDRYNHRLHLNDRGRAFLSYVNQSLEFLDQGVLEVSEIPDKISGPIHIRVMENSRFVITSIAEFSKMYPAVSFYICHDYYSNDDVVYDVCISSSPFLRNFQHSIPLIRERMVLAVCNQHPFAQKDKVCLSDLKYEKFITQSVRSALYEITINNCHSCGFEPQIIISCDDPYYIRKYVSENMGIAIAPSISWAGRFRENTKLIEIVDSPIYTSSFLQWNENKSMNPVVNRFCRFLKEKALNVPENLQTT